MNLALKAIPGVAQAKAALAAGKAWIWLCCALAVFAFGAYCGIRWDQGKVEEAKRERDNARNDVIAWQQASQGWQGAAEKWAARYKADEEHDKQMAQQANRILADLEEMGRRAQAQQADWNKRFTAAKKSPACAELLKETQCAAFSGY